MKIYPAIDIKDGKCVRLIQGDMSKDTIYGDPVEMAVKWQSMGAQYIHVVDLDAAFAGKFVNKDVIKDIVHSVKIPVQVGGGIRTKKDIEERIENAGISRVIIGTMACEDAELVKWGVAKYDDRIAVGIDAKDGLVVTKGWAESTDIAAADLAKRMHELGVDTIIYTDISRDGMMSGPNIQKTEELVKKTWMNVIASGGVSSIEDIIAVRGSGACGVIIGKALYEGKIDFKEAMKVRK